MNDRNENEFTHAVAAKPFWHAPWEFAVHSLVGSFIFLLIAGIATLLDWAVQFLEAHKISSVVVVGCRTAEYVILITDLVLYAVFLWRTARRTIDRL